MGPRRGRTRPGRLARLDAWLGATEGRLLARRDGVWARAVTVDLGLGDEPATSVELSRLVQPLVVVDHAEARVESARAAGLDARLGGFDLPLREDEPARVVRAMNVLRGYRPKELAGARYRLGERLLPGGLLLEGSSDALGGVLVVYVLRKGEAGLHPEGILFSTDFTRGFAPRLFEGWLPRDLRRLEGAGALRAFLGRWTAAWAAARAEGQRAPRAAFAAAAARLPDVDPSRAALGDLLWRPATGSP